jgi:hypothetical protein
MINWKGCGRKWSLSDLRYYHKIFLKKLTKTMKHTGHNSLSLGPPKYKMRQQPGKPGIIFHVA